MFCWEFYICDNTIPCNCLSAASATRSLPLSSTSPLSRRRQVHSALSPLILNDISADGMVQTVSNASAISNNIATTTTAIRLNSPSHTQVCHAGSFLRFCTILVCKYRNPSLDSLLILIISTGIIA